MWRIDLSGYAQRRFSSLWVIPLPRMGPELCKGGQGKATEHAGWWRTNDLSQARRNKGCQEAEYGWNLRRYDIQRQKKEGGLRVCKILKGHDEESQFYSTHNGKLLKNENSRVFVNSRDFWVRVLQGRGENDTLQGKQEHGYMERSCLEDKVIVAERHKVWHIWKEQSSQAW